MGAESTADGGDEDESRQPTAPQAAKATQTAKAPQTVRAGATVAKSGVQAAKAGATAATRRLSRRFPLLTRDTARPEGGGRAASGDFPAPYRQWPILAVLGGVFAGLLLTLLDARIGTLTIGVFLLLGMALRWLLPSVGMLAVRSRFTDLVTYGVLGTAIVLLALMAQPDPWLELPFLEDIIRFSVR